MKIRWLINNVPEVKTACDEKRCMFGTVDSWLIYKLTGGVDGGIHITDVTNASRTMLMDLDSCKWSQKTCEEIGIPMHILPEIRSSSEVYAEMVDSELKGIPLAGCLGDQQSAMVGQLCFNTGNVKNTYGTGCFMLMNTGTTPVQSAHGLLSTACFQLGPDAPVFYALEGSVAIAGAAISWMRDQLGLVKNAAEVSALAMSVADTGGVYFVPAFSGLFAPYWRSDARGTICGLTLNTNKAHIARAVLEAVCYRSREVIDAMQEDSKTAISSLRVDGGMSASEPMLQFQADIVDVSVTRPKMVETTALGAAIAAGLATKFWKSTEEVAACIGSKVDKWEPAMTADKRQAGWKQWKKVVERALNWESTDEDE
jgi:glycerol kinase